VQLHDYNPGIAPNGLFWTARVPDAAFTKDDAAGTARLVLTDFPVVDTYQIFSGNEDPATVSFDITWTETGAPRHLRPMSSDPTDPRNLAGEFKDAFATGTFSGSGFTAFGSGVPFSFTGTADTAFGWGEMGTEQNGSFLNSRRGRGSAG
jgi:hypothetical protein